MPLRDDTSPDGAYDAHDQLRHDLKTPLTTILARAHLLARGVQRSPSLSEEERGKMLAGLTSIAEAVQQLVTVIDGMQPREPDC
jgi:K+-sensing histidine kinase KdpD